MTQNITALYLRVSSTKQVEHGTSLDYQEEACWKMAKELGVPDELIKIYREEGFSGEDIERPEMEKLRDDVKKRLIKRIIILHPDRLSRNMVDRLVVCTEFEKYEVELLFVDTEYKNTEEGKLFFNISSSIAEYELALIKKRTSRGIIKAVKDGKVMPMRFAPYGYDLVGTELIINNDEAPFVRKIYQWYVYDKLTMREIGERLASQNAIPKRKNVPIWSASTIQKILKNETYIGKFYYNRRKVSKVKGERTKGGKPKKVYEYRDKEEWIEIEVPAIVDVATFSLTQEQREKNTKNSGNIKHEYLLRQKIRCGHCGVKYSSYATTSYSKSRVTGEKTSSRVYKRYRCVNGTHRQFGEGVELCDAKQIRADYLDDYIWNELVMLMVNDTDEIIEKVKQTNEKPSDEIIETYNLLQFKVKKFEEEKSRIINLYKKGYIDEDEMDRDLGKVEKEIKTFKKEMEKYEKQIVEIGKSEVSLDMLKQMIDEIREKINHEEEISFKVKRQIIELLIDDIILKWNGDQLKVTCVGVIDTLMNAKNERNRDSELSTQHQVIVDTTNNVINLTFESLISLDMNGVKYNMTVLNKELKIG